MRVVIKTYEGRDIEVHDVVGVLMEYEKDRFAETIMKIFDDDHEVAVEVKEFRTPEELDNHLQQVELVLDWKKN